MTSTAPTTTAPTTTAPAAPPRARRLLARLRRLAARRPLTSFSVIAFGLAYPLVSLPLLASHGLVPGGTLLESLPMAPDETAGLLMVLSLTTASLTVTWAADGPDGVRQLVRRIARWRLGWGWWLAALAALPAVGLAVALVLGDGLRPVDGARFVVVQAGLLGVNLLLVNLWEETAWSGVVQTRLERRHGLPVAALVTAVPFALMHWPLSLFGDPTVASVAVGLASYLVLGLLFRPMLAVFLRGGRDSVLLVAVLHSVFNRTNNDNGILAGLTTQGGAEGLAILVSAVVVTAGAALVLGRRLGRAYRRELDGSVPTGPVRR